MPVGYWLTVEIVAVEPIRRLAVHVFPRAARFGNGDTRQHTANTTRSQLKEVCTKDIKREEAEELRELAVVNTK